MLKEEDRCLTTHLRSVYSVYMEDICHLLHDLHGREAGVSLWAEIPSIMALKKERPEDRKAISLGEPLMLLWCQNLEEEDMKTLYVEENVSGSS